MEATPRRVRFVAGESPKKEGKNVNHTIGFQRVQQVFVGDVFVGDEELQPGRYYLTTFVTEQGVTHKYGRTRQQHTERSIDALRAYLAGHRPLRVELRGTFVAV